MDQLKPSSVNSSPLTPLTFLERAALAYGESISIVYKSSTYTWSETYLRCLRLASSICSLIGIKKGQVVSVLAPNTPPTYELQFAVPMAGAVLNNLNTRLDAKTISVLLQHSESKLVFVDYQLYSLVLQSISLFPSDVNPPVLVLVESENSVRNLDFDECITYEAMLVKGSSKFNWIRPENDWEPMTLNYTSGTTASPKGVVHSHRSLFIITVDSLIDWSVPSHPVYLWTLPMFHSNGWSYTWGMAAVGGTNICLRKFDANVVFRAINKYNVTHMCGAPVVLTMLANFPGAKALKHRVHFRTGGAPPPPTIVLRVESLGFVVNHGYGMTEVAGVVVSCIWKPKWDTLPANVKAKLKSRQGIKSLGMTEVDVVDPESRVSVKRDGVTMGEIVLRGGCIMLGYLKNQEATSKCMKNNWLYTGDLAVMHPDGYLEIKDRSKDIIISGGENVSSVEVESVLYSHTFINEAAVVARPDEFWGETPCAFVSLKMELKRKPLKEKEIIDFCRERLPHYMIPKTVIFMDELPKTATGKIQKLSLREIANDMGQLPVSRM